MSTTNTFSGQPQTACELCLGNKERKSGGWQPRAETKVQKCPQDTVSPPPSVPPSLVCRSFIIWLLPHGCITAATAPHIMSMFKERRKNASFHQGRKKLPRCARADHVHSRRPELGHQGVRHTEQLAEETRTDIAVINQRDSSPGPGRSRENPRSAQ